MPKTLLNQIYESEHLLLVWIDSQKIFPYSFNRDLQRGYPHVTKSIH